MKLRLFFYSNPPKFTVFEGHTKGHEAMNIVSFIGLFLIFAFAVLLLAKERMLDSTRNIVLCTGLIMAALMLRLYWFDVRTPDYRDFLAPWIDFYRNNGGFKALNQSVGNYNVPYLYFLAAFSYFDVDGLYLIKLLSVFFDVILAYAMMKLVSLFVSSKDRQLVAFFGILFLPTVVLNGSTWGQCDSIYAAFAVLGIWLALEDRPIISMICFAASFSFKLQAVFVLPIIAVLWYRGYFKLWHALIFPAAYVVIVLPAILAGRPFWDTITLYLNQTSSIGTGLNYNSSSMFALFNNNADVEFWSKAGVILAFIYMFAILIWLYCNRYNLSDYMIYAAALLFAIGIPFILPHMHDRYFFCADVLSVGFAVIFPGLVFVPVLVQFASLLGYHAYLKMRYLMPMSNGAIALIAALLILLAFTVFYLPTINQKRTRRY